MLVVKAHLHQKLKDRNHGILSILIYIHNKPQHRRLARAPDFVRSPDKWAKYSLADDGTNDLKGASGVATVGLVGPRPYQSLPGSTNRSAYKPHPYRIHQALGLVVCHMLAI